MKIVKNVAAVIFLLLTPTSCSSSNQGENDSPSADSVQLATEQPIATDTDTEVEINHPDLQRLAVFACSDNPVRMPKDAEVYTEESWTCSLSGEQVRIDLFTDRDQRKRASEAVLEFYKSVGDNRNMSELPIVCGETWAIGVDYNETRDLLLQKFTTEQIEATTC